MLYKTGWWLEFEDIDSSSILLQNEINPDSLRSNSKKQVALAKFSREEVQAMLLEKGQTGRVELAIRCALKTELDSRKQRL